MSDISKQYNFKEEDRIYKLWEESGFFNPDSLPAGRAGLKGDPYSIMMPPPNVTGVLHLGHSLENSLMDVMARFQRMRGKKVLLLPGTDHAAVATQAKVEKVLMEKGIKNPREELGREKLLEEIRNYAENSKSTILKQIRKMGTSCDWSRLAYTFDEKRNLAVNTVFKKMYDDGLIYRGKRMINWDPKLQTTISDDEIVWQEEKVPFYYLQYGPFIIATARPETKFGDKYVVMHPDDKRYKKYKHGDKFECEWINGKITATVIKDEVIDPEFGTGVMTITPWHDMIDFEIAQRHKLSGEQIIDFNGRLLPIAGEFAGLDILEARPKIVDKLKDKGLVTKVEENYIHRVAKGDRSNGLVEPQIKEQWFVDVNKKIPGKEKSLKELMHDAVALGHNNDPKQKIKITPERFEKTYFSWIENLRDWCISRQIWWGHRIPVWYKKTEKPIKITFFAHGSTEANQNGEFNGNIDPDLSKLGIEQSEKLKDALKNEEFDLIYVSDFKRAIMTAEIAFQGRNIKIIQDKRLREINLGNTNEITEEKIFESDVYHINNIFPNGESYKDVELRIFDFLNELTIKHPGKKIAIITHRIPQLALEVILNNKSWEEALNKDWRKTKPKSWQVGWKYELEKLQYVNTEAPKETGWEQDEDTLDTWFSSGLWTFSTLGWPQKNWEQNFHPTSWMQMGYEILFFWMARMILMSTYSIDQIPFKDVYIHGILRSETGKKFSKSSGNAIDPIEIIDKYGCDALRLSLIAGVSPGNDSKFYEEKVESSRNFVNKFWNIARYIISNSKERENEEPVYEKLTLADNWILSKLDTVIKEVTGDISKFQFSQAAEKLRDFTWGDFADWYVEISKFEDNKKEKQWILNNVLENTLKLWHPFIPFVTENIWRKMNKKDLLIVSEWPKTGLNDLQGGVAGTNEIHFDLIKEIIISIRNGRLENNIEPGKKISVIIDVKNQEEYLGRKTKDIISSQENIIKSLRTGIEDLKIVSDGNKIENTIQRTVAGINIYIPLEGLIDTKKEKEKVEKEIANVEKYLSGLNARLENEEFMKKAAKDFISKIERSKRHQEAKIIELKKHLESLK